MIQWVIHIVQGVLTLGFLMSGFSKLFLTVDQMRETYTIPFGYEPSFMYLISVIEIIAALGLIVGYRWRRIAVGSSLMLVLVMFGAIVSHVMANQASNMVLAAAYLVLLIVLLVRLILYEGVMKEA